MDPATAKQLTAILAVLAGLVEQLGAGGLLALTIGSPVLMLLAFAGLSWLQAGRAQKLLETYQHQCEEQRKTVYDLWERHRAETKVTLDQFAVCLQKTTRFYEDNVELVKRYQQTSDNLQDLVIGGTRAVERLASNVETALNLRRNNP